MERITLKESPTIASMPKDDEGNEAKENEAQGNEIQGDDVEPTQQLLKDWRYNPHHPKDLVIGDISRGNYSF